MKYDYQCEVCDLIFELEHSADTAPTMPCPKCDSNYIKRVILNSVPFVLNGSGFPSKDNRKISTRRG